jgi:hypothetical protein
VEELSAKAGFYVSAHPNAGLPNQFGEYDQSAIFMASVAEEFMEKGWVNIIGGCCGTTPEHIEKLAEKAAVHAPRRKPEFTRQYQVIRARGTYNNTQTISSILGKGPMFQDQLNSHD